MEGTTVNSNEKTMNSRKRKAEDSIETLSAKDNQVASENARKMMETLNRQQLLEILQDAVSNHTDVLNNVCGTAQNDPALRKLFVRNLGRETSTETLRSIFSEFGEVEEAAVITEKNTGKGKGYGFVTFKDVQGALGALKDPSKKIDGRITVCRWASADISDRSAADVEARKIFVGNVPRDVDSDSLLTLFSEYGEIEEGPLGFDKQQTGKHKNFALLIFKSADGAKGSLEDPVKTLNGHKLFCKLAVEGQRQRSPAANNSRISNPGFGIPAAGFVNSAALDPPAVRPYRGSNHNVYHQNLGGLPGGPMGQPLNLPFMNPGWSAVQAASNPAAVDGGYPGQAVGSYGFSEVGYGHMGPVSGAQGPYAAGDVHHLRNQHQQAGVPQPFPIAGRGIYPSGYPFYQR